MPLHLTHGSDQAKSSRTKRQINGSIMSMAINCIEMWTNNTRKSKPWSNHQAKGRKKNRTKEIGSEFVAPNVLHGQEILTLEDLRSSAVELWGWFFGEREIDVGQFIFHPHKPISNTVRDKFEQLNKLYRHGTLWSCMGGGNVGDNLVLFLLLLFNLTFVVFMFT